jgi:hypothetical protein
LAITCEISKTQLLQAKEDEIPCETLQTSSQQAIDTFEVERIAQNCIRQAAVEPMPMPYFRLL